VDPERAADELRRAVSLGLRGGVLMTNVRGARLDEDRFRPIFESAAELDVPIVLHPTPPAQPAPFVGYALMTIVGFIAETTVCTLRLVLSGLPPTCRSGSGSEASRRWSRLAWTRTRSSGYPAGTPSACSGPEGPRRAHLETRTRRGRHRGHREPPGFLRGAVRSSPSRAPRRALLPRDGARLRLRHRSRSMAAGHGPFRVRRRRRRFTNAGQGASVGSRRGGGNR